MVLCLGIGTLGLGAMENLESHRLTVLDGEGVFAKVHVRKGTRPQQYVKVNDL